MFPIAIGSIAVFWVNVFSGRDSPFFFCSEKNYRLLAPDETAVTLIKTGSSGTFSLFALFSTIMLPLQGNYSCILFSLLSFFSFSPITHYSYYLSLLFTIHYYSFPQSKIYATPRKNGTGVRFCCAKRSKFGVRYWL